MLLASCHGLSGRFSAFLLGASPPNFLGDREKNGLVLATTFCKPWQESESYSRVMTRALLPLLAPLYAYTHETRHVADCRKTHYGQGVVFVTLAFLVKIS